MKMQRYIMKIWMVVLVGLTLSCGQDEEPGKDKEKPLINPSGRYSFVISGGRTPAKGEMPDTRAYLDLDTYEYWWDPKDVVVMAVTRVDEPARTVSGFESMDLAAMNLDERVLRTTFLADLVQQEYMNLMNAGTHFDFYSYFPTDIHGLKKTSFPSFLDFTLPDSYTLEPDVFVPAQYAPMVGVVKNKEPEIFFPEEDVDPVYQLGGLHFNYEHILSYAAIEMDVRLLPEDVTSITMTVGNELNNNTRITGEMEYMPYSGDYTLTGGSNSVTVNITDGLSAGSGSAVYIPMPVKDLSGQQLTFTFTTANSDKYAYRPLTTASGVNFERGKIHRIRVAPAAQYAEGTSFTLTASSGYYYIEAWGGDGGKGGSGRGLTADGIPGNLGESLPQRGLFELSANAQLYVQVGVVGSDGSGNTSSQGGGKSGGGVGGVGGTATYFGHGHTGGNGGNGALAYVGGGGGGGGGSASGVLYNGTTTSDIVIASGGGGGGGGGSANTAAGNGGRSNQPGTAGNAAGGSTWSTSSTNGQDVASGSITGTSGTAARRGGGGGGGAGGGWNGGAGGGGLSGNGGGTNASGGGGAGGASYSINEAANPGYTLPANQRPSANGYVVITYFREK